MSQKDNLIKAANVFKILADPTRLRMIRLLASNMEDKLCVIDLAKKLGITQPAASQHLKILKSANLLYTKTERPRIYYYLNLIELRKQKENLDDLFALAFTKCSKGGQCQDCPFLDLCDVSKT
ncbi:MAG: winged helix-turn-helix transcriptional regulator [Candidatus Heimdallarchaeota archaeon]